MTSINLDPHHISRLLNHIHHQIHYIMDKSTHNSVAIIGWSKEDQPRYKLLKRGLNALSNSELIAILINTGTREKNAIELSRELLDLNNHSLEDLGKMSYSGMRKVKGIGESKAMLLIAAFELGGRRQTSTFREKLSITGSLQVAEHLKVLLKDFNHEVFAVVFLNRANKIKHFEIISHGGMTATIVDPRIILKKAVEQEASYLILSHNHPSGNLRPSKADEEITKKICHAASYFDIKVLDHIIVSEEGYFSFANEGMIL